MEFVEVPFEQTTLPAIFLKAPGVTGRAPTVVVFDGMDNCKEMSILFNGLEFAARGWHTLAIDGPGQGESLRLRELYARHDYEVAGTAAYDYVSRRPDVDAEKSDGDGLQLRRLLFFARVAAFENAMLRASLSRRCIGISRAGSARSSAGTKWIPKNTAQSAFHFRWIMGHIDDAEAAIEKAKKFSLARRCAGQITCPFLIVHGSEDKVVPVASAHKLFEAVGSKENLRILHPGRRRDISRSGRQPASRRRLHRGLDQRYLEVRMWRACRRLLRSGWAGLGCTSQGREIGNVFSYHGFYIIYIIRSEFSETATRFERLDGLHGPRTSRYQSCDPRVLILTGSGARRRSAKRFRLSQ